MVVVGTILGIGVATIVNVIVFLTFKFPMVVVPILAILFASAILYLILNRD